MQLFIENGRVIIELTGGEFDAFESMFGNLNAKHRVLIEGADWPENSNHNANYAIDILPMHLCRTIGEACAVGNAGPLDIISLYPFWKYGFLFSDETDISFSIPEPDPHKRANLSDEFGMGFCAWAMEEIFHAEAWCDTADALSIWDIKALGMSRPDFVCLFDDGSFGFFEAKGTTRGRGTANSQANTGKYQTAQLEPISGIVSVRCCCAVSLEEESGTRNTRLLLKDPPANGNARKVKLTRENILRGAESRRHREKTFGDITTIFRGPDKLLKLKRTPFIEEKKHGWLDLT